MAMEITANVGSRIEPRTIISTMKMPMTTSSSMFPNCSFICCSGHRSTAVETSDHDAGPGQDRFVPPVWASRSSGSASD